MHTQSVSSCMMIGVNTCNVVKASWCLVSAQESSLPGPTINPWAGSTSNGQAVHVSTCLEAERPANDEDSDLLWSN